MNEPTVTLATADAGEITLPEPSWCAGHTHHDPQTVRADLIHSGPPASLVFLHHEFLETSIVQSPFATTEVPGLGGRTPGASVYPLGKTLDPAELHALADALIEHGYRLRRLAAELNAILLGGAR